MSFDQPEELQGRSKDMSYTYT